MIKKILIVFLVVAVAAAGLAVVAHFTSPGFETAQAKPVRFQIVSSVVNGSLSGSTKVAAGANGKVTLVPDEGYLLPSSIEVTGVESFEYDAATGLITLTKAKGKVTVSASCVQEVLHYNLTVNAKYCTAQTSQFGDDGTATVTITPGTGMYLPSVAGDQITVTNADIQSYDNETGVLVIENPVGDVVVEAACMLQSDVLQRFSTSQVLRSGDVLRYNYGLDYDYMLDYLSELDYDEDGICNLIIGSPVTGGNDYGLLIAMHIDDVYLFGNGSIAWASEATVNNGVSLVRGWQPSAENDNIFDVDYAIYTITTIRSGSHLNGGIVGYYPVHESLAAIESGDTVAKYHFDTTLENRSISDIFSTYTGWQQGDGYEFLNFMSTSQGSGDFNVIRADMGSGYVYAIYVLNTYTAIWASESFTFGDISAQAGWQNLDQNGCYTFDHETTYGSFNYSGFNGIILGKVVDAEESNNAD